jgi:hypothetical protein
MNWGCALTFDTPVHHLPTRPAIASAAEGKACLLLLTTIDRKNTHGCQIAMQPSLHGYRCAAFKKCKIEELCIVNPYPGLSFNRRRWMGAMHTHLGFR